MISLGLSCRRTGKRRGEWCVVLLHCTAFGYFAWFMESWTLRYAVDTSS
jgi:hypothetical protein